MCLIQSIPWYQDPVAWSVIATAVGTIVYAIISLGLWKATKRTAGIAERSADITQRIFEAANRPYVGVVEVNFNPLPQATHIPIKIKNSGTVIASSITIEVNCFHNEVPFRAEPPEVFSDVLIPGTEFYKDIVVRRDSFNRAVANGEEVIVTINIEYTGLTDIKYRSEARFAFTPDITAFTARGRNESIVPATQAVDNLE